jgi:hypothetical protein
MSPQTIRIHVDAPPKPAVGEPCNGCGVCCAAEPCPAGVIVSGRRYGECKALMWRDAAPGQAPRYLCGLLADPGRYTGLRSVTLQRWLVAVARRSISAGSGCDATLEVEPHGPADQTD